MAIITSVSVRHDPGPSDKTRLVLGEITIDGVTEPAHFECQGKEDPIARMTAMLPGRIDNKKQAEIQDNIQAIIQNGSAARQKLVYSTFEDHFPALADAYAIAERSDKIMVTEFLGALPSDQLKSVLNILQDTLDALPVDKLADAVTAASVIRAAKVDQPVDAVPAVAVDAP